MISPMLRYGTLFSVSIIMLTALSFVLAHLFPGDLVTNMSGVIPQSAEEEAEIIKYWALDQNYLQQFLRYVTLLFAGEWGVSIASGASLSSEISRTLPATIELSVYAMVVAILVGVPLGCIAGLRAYSKVDYAINSAAIVNYSMPPFWLGLAFILVFSLQLNWLPLSGRISLLYDVPAVTGFILVDIMLADMPGKWEAFSDAIAHLAMPTLSVALIAGAALVRMVRRAVIDVLDKPYIASARSRGLNRTSIFFDHVLRNALLPVLPLLALQITTLVTNAIIVETIFSWPGIGNWLLQAIYQQDYSAIRAGMLVVSTLIISLTILIDIMNRIIDPSKRTPSNVPV